MIINYGSVCSGIEAATAAWHPLGWKAAFYSEIDAFPRAVLQHHFLNTPIHGDFTTIQEHDYDPIDLLVGGTPCQSFSIAGLRKGLADERGNLTLEFIRLAQRLRPQWVVWENVPGVLSQDKGRAFGSLLGGLAECGYGFAYRVLDAQYFGTPQRRRRVFVVGYLGDWRPAAAVLFERESLCGDITPHRKAGEDVAKTLTTGTGKRYDFETEDFVVIPQHSVATMDVAGTMGSTTVASDRAAAGYMALHAGRVRRITPRECERLQGFPDDYTLIPYRGKPAADSPRYKALGNSMAVPVMKWLGERIQTFWPE